MKLYFKCYFYKLYFIPFFPSSDPTKIEYQIIATSITQCWQSNLKSYQARYTGGLENRKLCRLCHVPARTSGVDSDTPSICSAGVRLTNKTMNCWQCHLLRELFDSVPLPLWQDRIDTTVSGHVIKIMTFMTDSFISSYTRNASISMSNELIEFNHLYASFLICEQF